MSTNILFAIFFVGAGFLPACSSRSGAMKRRAGITGSTELAAVPAPTSINNPVPRRIHFLFMGLLLIGLFLALTIPAAVLAGEKQPYSAEQREVAAAARRYLEAEVKRDYKAVFGSLYPASDYRKANDFAAYLAEARSTPVGIESFQVLGVSILPEVPDREKWPEVSGFARVEVDVVIRFADTGAKSLVNYSFPFVRSGGKWYKL